MTDQPTTVCHVLRDEYDIYCGRANPRYHLKAHPLANPFRIGRDGTLPDVLRLYRNHLMSSPHLLRLIPALRGKRLACWCHSPVRRPGDHDCHLDLVAQLADNPPPMPLTEGPFDPTIQACFGRYGYGSGYFATEGQALAAVNKAIGGLAHAFCDRCPRRQDCWTEHQRIIGEADPESVKAYFARVAEYQDSHRSERTAFGIVAAEMATEGNPDPWMVGYIRNFKQGDADRA